MKLVYLLALAAAASARLGAKPSITGAAVAVDAGIEGHRRLDAEPGVDATGKKRSTRALRVRRYNSNQWYNSDLFIYGITIFGLGALAMALLACCKYLKIGPLYGPGGRFSDE